MKTQTSTIDGLFDSYNDLLDAWGLSCNVKDYAARIANTLVPAQETLELLVDSVITGRTVFDRMLLTNLRKYNKFLKEFAA